MDEPLAVFTGSTILPRLHAPAWRIFTDINCCVPGSSDELEERCRFSSAFRSLLTWRIFTCGGEKLHHQLTHLRLLQHLKHFPHQVWRHTRLAEPGHQLLFPVLV